MLGLLQPSFRRMFFLWQCILPENLRSSGKYFLSYSILRIAVRRKQAKNRPAAAEKLHGIHTAPKVLIHSRGGTGSGLPESTPAGFCVFLSDPDPDPESKICEKPDPDLESLFNISSCRSLCGHFLSKNMVNYGRIDDCSRSLNRSRILKFEE